MENIHWYTYMRQLAILETCQRNKNLKILKGFDFPEVPIVKMDNALKIGRPHPFQTLKIEQRNYYIHASQQHRTEEKGEKGFPLCTLKRKTIKPKQLER